MVSSRMNPYKALALPASGSVAEFNDFVTYPAGEAVKLPTFVRMVRENAALVIDVLCTDPEPAKICAGNTEENMSVWQGDLLEFFFGDPDGGKWQRQLCVGAGGGRFDSYDQYGEWSAVASVGNDGWRARVRLPLASLPGGNCRIAFNVARQSLHAGEYSSWCHTPNGFSSIENHGDLFFCSYEQALFTLFRVEHGEAMKRADFEKFVQEHLTFAWQTIDAPVLLNPRDGGMSLLWRTAGGCAAAVEYRKCGDSAWLRSYSALTNAVCNQREACHRTELETLEPGAEYEYRLLAMPPQKFSTPVIDPELHRFRAPGAKNDFAFAMISDLHSQENLLNLWLRLAQNDDLLIALGDFLANRVCMDNLFRGFFAPAGKMAPSLPLLVSRGNHEQDETGQDDSRFLAAQSGKSYGLFRGGQVAFLLLDTGNDHDDEEYGSIRHNREMISEECRWLAETLATEAWKKANFRIVLAHIPPYTTKKYDGRISSQLLESLDKAAGMALPDLLLCGHLHEYTRLMPGAAPLHAPGRKVIHFTDPADLPRLNYPLIVNSNDTMLRITGDGKSMRIDAYGPDGKIFDGFVIEKCH